MSLSLSPLSLPVVVVVARENQGRGLSMWRGECLVTRVPLITDPRPIARFESAGRETPRLSQTISNYQKMNDIEGLTKCAGILWIENNSDIQ